MLSPLKTYLNEGSVYYGLEVYEQGKNVLFNLLEVRRKKQELFIGGQHTFSTMEEVPKHVKKDAPLFVVFATQSVLTKVVAANTGQEHEAIVHGSFPNLDFSTFYYQLVPMEETTVVNICKKEHLDLYLNRLMELKLPVTGFALGISPFAALLDFLTEDSMPTSTYRVQLQNRSIQEVRPIEGSEPAQKTHYDLNGLSLPHTHLLVFASILGMLSKGVEGFNNFGEELQGLQKEFRNKRHFGLLLKSSLIFVLSLLLLNFLVFTYYFQKVETLQNTSALNRDSKSKLVALKRALESKEERVNTLLATTNSKATLYVDQMAMSLPVSMLFTEIQYQPLEKPMRPKKPIQLLVGTITVRGTASNGNDFSSWVETLESFAWTKSVETQDYDYGNRGLSNFTLKIEIHDE